MIMVQKSCEHLWGSMVKKGSGFATASGNQQDLDWLSRKPGMNYTSSPGVLRFTLRKIHNPIRQTRKSHW